MILYAPRLPADPLAHTEYIRFVGPSFRALLAPCLGTTLALDPTTKNPSPGTPTAPPTPHPPLSLSQWSEVWGFTASLMILGLFKDDFGGGFGMILE